MKPSEVPDDLIRAAVLASADRNHANLCGCVAWPEWCTSDYSPTQWEHGDEPETIAAVWPEIERRVREQTFREAADLLDSKPLHCEKHGSVTCTECPVGADHLRMEADRIARGESR